MMEMVMIKVGLPVVVKNGKDKSIYYVRSIDANEMCELSSSSGISSKLFSVGSIREAEDVELMIGYRLEQK